MHRWLDHAHTRSPYHPRINFYMHLSAHTSLLYVGLFLWTFIHSSIYLFISLQINTMLYCPHMSQHSTHLIADIYLRQMKFVDSMYADWSLGEYVCLCRFMCLCFILYFCVLEFWRAWPLWCLFMQLRIFNYLTWGRNHSNYNSNNKTCNETIWCNGKGNDGVLQSLRADAALICMANNMAMAVLVVEWWCLSVGFEWNPFLIIYNFIIFIIIFFSTEVFINLLLGIN